MNRVLFAHIAVLVANVIYGANYTIAKEVMPDYIQPFGFIVLRCLGATPLFWLIGLTIKEKVSKKDIGLLAIAAVFGVAINQLMFFKGLNYTTPINAAVIMPSTPIIVMIIAAFVLKERVTFKKVLGIAIGLSGTLLILLAGKEISFDSKTFIGDLMIFINASCYGVYLVMITPLMRKYHPITVIKWVFLFGTLTVLPFGWNEFLEIDFATMPSNITWATLYVVFGLSFFAYLLNIVALKKLSPSVVSIYVYLQPLLAAGFAIGFGKDELTMIKVAAAFLICSGVYLVSTKPKTA
jgi:drug/metabolite transporter (DMT)-like permease